MADAPPSDAITDTLPLVREPFDAVADVPGSKSITNRALVIAALARGTTKLTGALFADDTWRMIENLQTLGFDVEVDEQACNIRVEGEGGHIPADNAELFCGNSGTTIRFLAAFCTLGRGTFELDGIERMRQRPIGPLVQMLGVMGASIDSSDGYPPLTINADGLPGGRKATYGAETSSQYLSAALMAAPYAKEEVHVQLLGEQTSWPYVSLTMRLMDEFRVTPEVEYDPKTGKPILVAVPQGRYRGRTFAIEPDASAATYFLALAALHEGSQITVNGLGSTSLQGDVAFAKLLGRAGADVDITPDTITVTGTGTLRGIDADFADIPDTAQTFAVVALFADEPSTLTGLHTLSVKETDRIAALEAELTKLGAKVTATPDSLTIVPPARPKPASIATYGDHRMAMSFALAATRVDGVVIEDPACVNKTFPGYFDVMRRTISA
ncbi:MAG: 3-phosphoshikimate 1-carboxyvinyltransferase [Planctomycetota bacterium]